MQGQETETQRDIFQVPLQGFLVKCTSLEDAVAVKNANAALSGQDAVIYMPAELVRMAAVCLTYGRESAAEALKAQASRLRAAAFLQDSIGYQRPNNR